MVNLNSSVAFNELRVEIFKSFDITWGKSALEKGETFIVDLPQRDARRCHERLKQCGEERPRRNEMAESYDGGHLEKVT